MMDVYLHLYNSRSGDWLAANTEKLVGDLASTVILDNRTEL